MKKVIRLTESELHKIIESSVKRVINEIGDTEKGQKALSQVIGRSSALAMGNKGKRTKHYQSVNDASAALFKNGKQMYDGDSFRKGFQKGMKKLSLVGETTNDDIENRMAALDDMTDDEAREYFDGLEAEQWIGQDDFDLSDGDLYR